MSQISEEITAKVAGMLFEQIVRGLDYGTNVSKDLFKFAGAEIKSSTEALKNFGEQIRGKLGDQQFQRLIDEGEGKISLGQMDELLQRCHIESGTIKVLDEDAERFEKLLNQQHVLYAKINIKNDNCRMFVYLETDKEKIINASKIINAERGLVTELSPDLFLQMEDPTSLREIVGLDNVELELFRHYARQKNGLLFTVVPAGQNNNNIIINTSNSKAVAASQRTLTEVGWALTGRNGAKVREQIEYRLAGRTAILKSIDDAQKELYIVAKNHPDHFIHISNDEFEIYKANNLLKRVTKLDNNHEEFRDECVSACERIPHGVVLTAEEFENGISKEMLENRDTIDLFAGGFDEMIERQMMNDMVNLVQAGIKDRQRRQEAKDKENDRIKNATDKMELDDEGNSAINPWDESVTYAEFAQYEEIHDDDLKESREIQFEHFKDAAFYSNRNFETEDYEIKGDVDVIIEKAEHKRREREAAVTRMFDEKEKNNNYREENDVNV